MSGLVKKLHIKSGTSWLFKNPPPNYDEVLGELPHNTLASTILDGNFDGIQLFVKNRLELIQEFQIIINLLTKDTIFWVTYPKKSSGIVSDLEMLGSWDELTNQGLRIVSATSIDETWTALRFKPKELTKTSEGSNSQIKNNQFAEFIDVENKIVLLPPEIQSSLEEFAMALNFYQKLSYSNKKEYVLWVISAKQEKTKRERIEKMIEKLLQGKKNPSA